MNDPVNHPSHYTRGNIEVADFIEDQGLDKKAWLAMAIKYICRAGYKDPDKYCEDLEKAVWYLNREIARHNRTESINEIISDSLKYNISPNNLTEGINEITSDSLKCISPNILFYSGVIR